MSYNFTVCLAITLTKQHVQLFLCITCVSSVRDARLEVSYMQMLTEVERLIIESWAVWQLWALPGVEIDEG